MVRETWSDATEMSTAITELKKNLVPPAKPVEIPDVSQWTDIEKKMGITFPSDYREFCSVYGTGTLADPGRLMVTLFNPCSKTYEGRLQTHCEIFQDSKDMEGDEYVPYDVFPNSPGLLPWASDDNGNTVSWLTKGPPDKWPIVFNPHSGYQQWFEYAESMTGFLLKALQHKLDPSPWEDPFFTGPKRPAFVRYGDPLPYH